MKEKVSRVPAIAGRLRCFSRRERGLNWRKVGERLEVAEISEGESPRDDVVREDGWVAEGGVARSGNEVVGGEEGVMEEID
ncbi:unnamed protein product [Linum trigynum]|uniref:Uncharacterized protein n=1 Tax=Linum trigynum TaxID=586398 RepID=A0AAV2FB19_9ROSI